MPTPAGFVVLNGSHTNKPIRFPYKRIAYEGVDSDAKPTTNALVTFGSDGFGVTETPAEIDALICEAQGLPSAPVITDAIVDAMTNAFGRDQLGKDIDGTTWLWDKPGHISHVTKPFTKSAMLAALTEVFGAPHA